MPSLTFNPNNFVYLVPGNGAAGSTKIIDRSKNSFTITRFGNTAHSATMSKYYTTSVYADGSGDYLLCNDVSTAIASSDTWAIGGWFYLPALISGQNALFGFHGAGSSTINRLVICNSYVFGNWGAGTPNFSQEVGIGAWRHVMVQKTPTQYFFFIDGNIVLTITHSMNVVAGDRFSWCQEFDGANASDYTRAYMNDCFVYVGLLATEAFTPPAALVGSISGTVIGPSGTPAERTIIASPVGFPVNKDEFVQSTQSASDGTYTISNLIKGLEYSVVAQSDSTSYNDLVIREVAI